MSEAKHNHVLKLAKDARIQRDIPDTVDAAFEDGFLSGWNASESETQNLREELEQLKTMLNDAESIGAYLAGM